MIPFRCFLLFLFLLLLAHGLNFLSECNLYTVHPDTRSQDGVTVVAASRAECEDHCSESETCVAYDITEPVR